MLDEFSSLHNERNEMYRSLGQPEVKLDSEIKTMMNDFKSHVREFYTHTLAEKNRSKETYKKIASTSEIAENELEGKVENDLLDKPHKNREHCKKLAEFLGESYYSSGEEWNIYH